MMNDTCEACQEPAPVARYCIHCGCATMLDIIPSTQTLAHDMSQRFGDDVETDGTIVSFDTINSNYDRYSRPLGGYLIEGEIPQAVCEIRKLSISGIGADEDSVTLSPSVSENGHLVLTDQRVVAVFPAETEPQVVPIKYEDIVGVESRTGWVKRKIVFTDAEKTEYVFRTAADEETFESVSALATERVQETGTAKATAVRFVQDIDDEIAAADEAETALRAVADIFAERDDRTRFDEVVADAESLSDLLGQDEGAQQAPDEQEPNATLPAQSTSRATLPSRVKSTVRGADAKDVGKYSLAAVFGGAAVAASVPFSTTAGVAALLAGGAATGAYASTHPDSLAASIDPIEFAMGVSSRGRRHNRNSQPGGYGVGTAYGLLEQLEETDPEHAYAEWLAQVDYDQVLEAAEYATSRYEQIPGVDNKRDASIVGGAAGFAGSYADIDDDFLASVDEQLQEIGSDRE